MSIISISKNDIENTFAKEISELWLYNVTSFKENEIISSKLDELYYLIGVLQLDAEKIHDKVIDNMTYFREIEERIYNKELLLRRIKSVFEESED